MSAELKRKLTPEAYRQEGTSPKQKPRIATKKLSVAREIYPLTSPGISVFGQNTLNVAMLMGDTSEVEGTGRSLKYTKVDAPLNKLVLQLLTRPVNFRLVLKKMKLYEATTIPGHAWSDKKAEGPTQRSRVMVIGKMPGRDDVSAGRYMTGPAGMLFLDAVRQAKAPGFAQWYITSLIRCAHPDGSGTIPAAWLRDFIPLLEQEIRIIRPEYILCLGTDASKALLGKTASLSNMEGRTAKYRYAVHRSETARPEYCEATVMTIVNPGQVMHQPRDAHKLHQGVRKFSQLIREEGKPATKNFRHQIIDNVRDLKAWLHRVKDEWIFAADAEWHGEHPQNAGSYIRTIQFSWARNTAVCIRLTHAGGDNAFQPDQPAAIRLLAEFFADPRRRVWGHFFCSDLEWLVPAGLDLRPNFFAPPDELGNPAGWIRSRTEGGMDTGLAAHSIHETAELGLTALGLRYTSIHRWDAEMDKWKASYCKSHNIKAKHMDGYGNCPAEILEPYSCHDASVTFELGEKFQKLLDLDHHNNNCREAFWRKMRALPALFEINTTGLPVERVRMDNLCSMFMAAKAEIQAKIVGWANWPEFKLGSVNHVREFLFGEQYNGKQTADGSVVRLRPKTAQSLELKPLLTSDKRPIQWEIIEAMGKEDEHDVGTGKQVLGVLMHVAGVRAEQVGWIRDWRYTDQMLKNFLRPPKYESTVTQPAGKRRKAKITYDYSRPIKDSRGDFVYSEGMGRLICDDGRIRTHLLPITDTGRCKSYSPNLQNMTKTREKDYRRILGAKYTYGLRSMFKAPPGYVIVSADYSGAELMGAAILSGSKRMIADCQRGQLPESDPNYYDIHSAVAVLSFKLDCPPTKAGLKSIPNPANLLDKAGCSYLRNLAKATVFGLMYGRGAKAIAMAAKEEGLDISIDEAQSIIDTLFGMYPELPGFFAACRLRVMEERWMSGCFGSWRRFELTYDRTAVADMERQAMNWPMQNLVADLVYRACDNYTTYRQKTQDYDMFKFALQIHDELLFFVRISSLDHFVDKVIPACMSKGCPVYPTDLNGMPTGSGPYYLGNSVDVEQYWSQPLSDMDCRRLGVNVKYARS